MGRPIPGDDPTARRVRRARPDDARKRSAGRRSRRGAADRRHRAARRTSGRRPACQPNCSGGRRGGRRASPRWTTSSRACSSRTSLRLILPTFWPSSRSGDSPTSLGIPAATLAPRCAGSTLARSSPRSQHDNWFPAADCRAEQQLITHSSFELIESVWGHYAWGITAAETARIETIIGELLAT